MWFFRSPKIIYGEDSLSFLGTLDIKKTLIVTDQLLSKTSIPSRVIDALGHDVDVRIFDEIGVEPKLSDIVKGTEFLEKFDPDCIIGVGGGSSMDAAKVLFAMNEIPGLSPFDITPINDLKLHKKSKLVEVPTTSGTGSECSWAAVFSDDVEKRKNEIASPEILADYAILDPSLVIDLPKEQTVNTATDAVTHAIEAYVSQWRNVFSDAMAEKALELIIPNISIVLKDPRNLDARNKVHIGASMAGISFSNSQIGLAHALGHAIGAEFKIAHGKAVGLYLPHVISFNYDLAKDRYEKLNSLFPEEYKSKDLSETVSKFLGAVGEARKVSEAGIDPNEYLDRIEEIVSLASESTGMLTNAKDSTSEDLRNIARSVV